MILPGRRVSFWLFFLLVIWGVAQSFSPGIMTVDSVDQLAQARKGLYSDWHPPLMAWVWRMLDKIYPGPMLFIGLNVLFLGLAFALPLYFLGYSIVWSALLVLGLLIFPTYGSTLGIAWKDVAFGTSMALASSFIWLSFLKPTLKPRVFTSLCFVGLLLFWSLALRHNAPPALLPLIFGLVYFHSKEKFKKHAVLKITVLSIAILAVLLGMVTGVSQKLVGNNKTYPVQQILLHDIVGVELISGEHIWPREENTHQPWLRPEDLRLVYSPDSVVDLYCCNLSPRHFSRVKDEGELTELKGAWLQTLRSHPVDYLEHRWRVFRNQLGLGRKKVCWPFVPKMNGGIPWWQTVWDLPYRLILRVSETTRNTWLFRGYIWLLASFCFIVFFVRKRKFFSPTQQFAVVPIISGIFYVLPYFFVSTTCDFRMHWWMAVAFGQGLFFWVIDTKTFRKRFQKMTL